ncbi:MAG: M50 family metallopeptidase [Actinomycetota bacterium]
MTQVLFVFLLLLAVGLHEFGHFITAKKFGMKVDKFFIGFGPKIWSFRRGETEYGFNWIPAGGYVRIAGMNPFEETPPEDAGRVFKAKPAWKRAIVLAAGSTMHFIIAFIVLAVLLITAGIPDGKATNAVDLVEPGTPAATAGLVHNDHVVAIDGAPVSSWEQIRSYIRQHPGAPVTFTIETKGTRRQVPATLAQRTVDGKTIGFFGVQPVLTVVKRSAPTAVLESATFMWTGAKESVKGLGKVLSPSTIKHLFNVVTGHEKRSIQDPASLVGVTRAAGQGGIANLFFLFVTFNIFIGVVHIMPLPPLDGGHLAVLIYEKIRRRDVDMRRLIPVTAVVLAVLGGLFVVTLYLDIVNPIPIKG